MNQVSAPEEMKLATLADLLSEITGRDILGHARHYDRNAEARIAGAAVIFGRIRELLRRFDNRLDDNRQVWPPIWLPVRREDLRRRGRGVLHLLHRKASDAISGENEGNGPAVNEENSAPMNYHID